MEYKGRRRTIDLTEKERAYAVMIVVGFLLLVFAGCACAWRAT